MTASNQHSDQVVDQLLATIRYAYVDGPARVQAEANLRSLVEQHQSLERDFDRMKAAHDRLSDQVDELEDSESRLHEQLETLRNFNEATRAAYATLYPATDEERLIEALDDLDKSPPSASFPASELHECPYCDGRGWNTIAVHDPTDPDGEPLPEQEQCATCGGSGEVSRPAKEPS